MVDSFSDSRAFLLDSRCEAGIRATLVVKTHCVVAVERHEVVFLQHTAKGATFPVNTVRFNARGAWRPVVPCMAEQGLLPRQGAVCAILSYRMQTSARSMSFEAVDLGSYGIW